MALRGFIRNLSFNTTTSPSSSFAPFGALQNDTLLNTTSAIPDLSATADTFGEIGFIEHIPRGVESLLCVFLLYMYIHLFYGTPCQIWREWKIIKRTKQTTQSALLDDWSSTSSRSSIKSIDTSSILCVQRDDVSSRRLSLTTTTS